MTLILGGLVACKKKPPEAGADETPTTVEAVPTTEAGGVTAAEMGTDDAWGGADTTTAVGPQLSPEERQRESVNSAAAALTNPTGAPGAAATLRDVTREAPDNAIAWYNLGLAYELQGSELEARKAYLSAIQADAGLSETYVNLGGLDMKAGKYGSAEAQYRLGIRNDDENMDLWSGLISALRAQGRLGEAEREAKNALAINTNALDVYANLGLIYIERGQLDLANFIIQKAITTVTGGKENASLHQNQGRVYQLQAKSADARASFETALELDPDLVSARLWLSDYLLDNRNYEDTVALLEHARELDPDNSAVHLNLGIAYRGVGRYEDSVKAYQAVIRLEPQNADPHLNLGILYGDYVKNYDDAVAEYETYRSMGGARADAIEDYIAKTRKEQEKVKKLEERRKRLEKQKADQEAANKALEDQQKREAEEAARAEAEAAKAAQEAAAQPTPEGTDGTPAETPAETPAPEEAPAPEGDAGDPWGG
ncbi:MAG: tetratricopeptide repeat protein [Proteobacteria bacterium]|nr:tetratricopeptide repeat protein [Pseudomonadota bacterium]